MVVGDCEAFAVALACADSVNLQMIALLNVCCCSVVGSRMSFQEPAAVKQD